MLQCLQLILRKEEKKMSGQNESNEELWKASYETSRVSFSGELQTFYRNVFDRIQHVEAFADLEAIQANLANDIATSMKSPCEGFKNTCQLLDALNPEASSRYLAESEHYSRPMIRDTVLDLMSCIRHRREELSPNHKSDSPLPSFEQICQASYETSKQNFLAELGVLYRDVFDRIQNVKTVADLEAIQANLANDIATSMKSPCEGFKTTCQRLDALNPEAPFSSYLANSEHVSMAMMRGNVFDLISCIGHKREELARSPKIFHNKDQIFFGSGSTEPKDDKKGYKP